MAMRTWHWLAVFIWLCFQFVLQLSCETLCVLLGMGFFFPALLIPFFCTHALTVNFFLMEIMSCKGLWLRERELCESSFHYIRNECWSSSTGVFSCNNSLKKTFLSFFTILPCVWAKWAQNLSKRCGVGGRCPSWHFGHMPTLLC